jgi:type III secretion protein Q
MNNYDDTQVNAPEDEMDYNVEQASHDYDDDDDDNDSYEEDYNEQEEHLGEQAQAAPELDSLSQLPLELTLRCGQISLTLGELRRLSSGTVLDVAGVTPGFATLCHGERVVAEGELVDVDGRLGLQITRMALAS